MNCRPFAVCLLCCAAAISAAAQAPPPKPLTPLEQTLFGDEKDFVAAAKKGDAAYFKRTLADDFTFVDFDGEIASRQDMLDMASSGGIDLLPYDMKLVPVSDDVAIVTYNVVLRVPAAEDQGPPPRYQHFSTVWIKQGDAWKMKFLQMTVAHWGDW